MQLTVELYRANPQHSFRRKMVNYIVYEKYITLPAVFSKDSGQSQTSATRFSGVKEENPFYNSH